MVKKLTSTIFIYGDLMSKLIESQETLQAIKAKAFSNAKKLGTYNTRSSFQSGRNILTFTEICARSSRRFS